MAVLLLYLFIFERVILPHLCTFKGAMCGAMEIGQPGRKRLISWRRGVDKDQSVKIGLNRGYSWKIVANQAYSRLRAVPSATASVKALCFAPPAARLPPVGLD